MQFVRNVIGLFEYGESSNVQKSETSNDVYVDDDQSENSEEPLPFHPVEIQFDELFHPQYADTQKKLSNEQQQQQMMVLQKQSNLFEQQSELIKLEKEKLLLEIEVLKFKREKLKLENAVLRRNQHFKQNNNH